MYTKEIDYIAYNKVDPITYTPYIILNHIKFNNFLGKILSRNKELIASYLNSHKIKSRNDIIKAIGLTPNLCELRMYTLYKINKDFDFKAVVDIYKHVY